MDLDHFKKNINQADQPPVNASIYLKALWLDGKGKWEQAHELIDDLENPSAYRLHAYLHRKEGDLSNAAYWYRRAGMSLPTISLQDEWDSLSQEHLALVN